MSKLIFFLTLLVTTTVSATDISCRLRSNHNGSSELFEASGKKSELEKVKIETSKKCQDATYGKNLDCQFEPTCSSGLGHGAPVSCMYPSSEFGAYNGYGINDTEGGEDLVFHCMADNPWKICKKQESECRGDRE